MAHFVTKSEDFIAHQACSYRWFTKSESFTPFCWKVGVGWAIYDMAFWLQPGCSGGERLKGEAYQLQPFESV